MEWHLERVSFLLFWGKDSRCAAQLLHFFTVSLFLPELEM